MKKKLLALTLAISLLLPNAAFAASYTHTVNKGESLWKIAQKYNLSVYTLKKINSLQSSMIYPGQKLLINNQAQIYRVTYGDTLWKISQKYGVSLQSLKVANNLRSSIIYVGQTIIIPKKKRTATTKHSQNDIDLLARLVRAEAEGEPYKGKVAVAAVVLNRVDSNLFPNTIPGVIYETYANGRYYAFSPVKNGEIYKPADSSSYYATYDALNGTDPTYGSLFFYNPVTSTSTWIQQSKQVTTQIGGHVFAK